MIGSIVSGLSSLLSGGATGIIGSVVTNVADYFEKKRDQSHEIRLRELDIQEMEKEYEYRSEITAQETQAAAQQTSYDHDARSYSSGVQVKSFWLKVPLIWADVIRALIRPILTLGLVFLVYLIFQKAQAVLQESDLQALGPESALAIYSTIIDMILYMASTAVTWWFGTRPRKQQKA